MVGFDPDLEITHFASHWTDPLSSFTVLLLAQVLAIYVYIILWACNNGLRSSLKTFSENGEPCIWICLVAGYLSTHTHIGCLRVITQINMLIQLIITVPKSNTNRISCLLLLEQAIWLLSVRPFFWCIYGILLNTMLINTFYYFYCTFANASLPLLYDTCTT